MTFLFLRCLPWLTGILGMVVAFEQWRGAASYPAPLIALFVVFLLSALWISWKRMPWLELIRALLPTCFALASMGFVFLLVEEPFARNLLTLAFGVVPFITLELLFVALFEPARYPVNGISRWNLVQVPLIACCLALGFNGLSVFVQMPNELTLAVFMVAGAALFGLTAHPSAHRRHHKRWMLLGGLVGLHAGVFNLLLPLAMTVHGALAALIFSVPLRMRRYAYDPVPSSTIAVSEGVLAALCFGVLLFTARWT